MIMIMMPPKSLINLAPPYPYPTKLKYLRTTQHATSPLIGEGRQGGSLGLRRSLQGKLLVPLSLKHLSWIQQAKT